MQLLAPFFRTLQQAMLEHAPCRSGTPHIVLLTPGPYNETYFEHACLSRYLGFTLAKGADLTLDPPLRRLVLFGRHRRVSTRRPGLQGVRVDNPSPIESRCCNDDPATLRVPETPRLRDSAAKRGWVLLD